jgi:drug/metabolite transporter (DMT)-like permease
MTDNLRGILAVLIASTAFVMNDALVKLVTRELPAGEIIVLRGGLATCMLVTGVGLLRAARPLRIMLTPIMLLRFGSAAAATTFIVISLHHLPLATVNAVLQFTPLAATVGAAVLFAEKVGWQRWAAAITAFFGVVLVVKPGGGFGPASFVVLAALAFSIVRDLSTRSLHHGIPSILIAPASTAAITLAGFLVAAFDEAWRAPSSRAWALLGSSATSLFVANTFIIIGLRTGEIAATAPFRYVPIPLSLALGYWWWDDVPDAMGLFGIGLVLAAGLYTLHLEYLAMAVAPAPSIQRSSAP